MNIPNLAQLQNPDIISVASLLPQKGRLVSSQGYTYLDIDNDYIHNLFPLLNDPKVCKPDYFDKYTMGAHITVIYPEETRLTKVEEVGQEFTFNIKSAYSGDLGPKRYYFLTVNAPALLKLRRKYGLPDLLSFKNYLIEFHITFAVAPLFKSSCL